MKADIIFKYFPDLSQAQKEQFEKLSDLYSSWNEKINVISRADIEHLYERHVLHSLAPAFLNLLADSQNILDVGTGGGFPGIPSAIFYPDKKFTLIDSIGKKILVAQSVIDNLNLKNVVAIKTKSTMFDSQFDTIISRAVTNFPDFVNQTLNNLKKIPSANIIYLKGGEFSEELTPFASKSEVHDIYDFFKEEFFETKKIIQYKPFI